MVGYHGLLGRLGEDLLHEVQSRVGHAPAQTGGAKTAAFARKSERARYDTAASEYNTAARSWWSAMWVRAFDMPPRMPLSNEITWQ